MKKEEVIKDRQKIFDLAIEQKKDLAKKEEELKEKYGVSISEEDECYFVLEKDGGSYKCAWTSEVEMEEEDYPKNILDFKCEYIDKISQSFEVVNDFIESLGYEEYDSDINYKIFEKKGWSILIVYYADNIEDYEIEKV